MYNILVLCTGNSCRSIIGEALFNQLGGKKYQAFSAGSHPTGRVNPNAIATLEAHGISTEGFYSKSWNALEDQRIDLIITVCDQAAGETCPIYLSDTPRAHWGLPDPDKVKGTDKVIMQAFEKTFSAMENRIKSMLILPKDKLSDEKWLDQLNEIGNLFNEA